MTKDEIKQVEEESKEMLDPKHTLKYMLRLAKLFKQVGIEAENKRIDGLIDDLNKKEGTKIHPQRFILEKIKKRMKLK